mmetsp:Transcript_165766/g.532274  ORF Transcript_165766/g.532274 Transcript_165766/m.532274 type:complete len:493 (-) Transcript_165766:68-1546(-)
MHCVTLGIALVIVAAAVASLGTVLSYVCLSELGVLFAAEALLILVWSCMRRLPPCAVMLYFVALCVLMVRETHLATSGRIPCGLFTFGDSCVETRCAEYNYFIGFQTSCARHACARFEHQELGESFASGEGPTPWLLMGLAGTWCAFLLSARQMWRWQGGSWETETGNERGLASVILAVPATYGLCAVHAVRVLNVNREDTWQAEGMMSAAELYSALGLYAFHRLLVAYTDCPVLRQRSKADQALWRGFRGLIETGLKQYVVLVFGCNALELVAKTWSWMNPSYCVSLLASAASIWFPHHKIQISLSDEVVHNTTHTRTSTMACEDLWNTVSLLMVVANFFTCSIALYAVLRYEHAFADKLKDHSPFWKFWGVKGLLSVNFMQRIVLMVVGALATRQISEDFRTFLNFFLVCIESAILALMNLWAYALPESSFLKDRGVADTPGGCAEEAAEFARLEEAGHHFDEEDEQKHKNTSLAEDQLAQTIGKTFYDD